MLIFVILALLAVILALPYWIISKNQFPQPSGQYRVGTSDLIWNEPTDIASTVHNREGIIAKVWYPTNHSRRINSPYIDKIGRTFHKNIGINLLYNLLFSKFFLGRITTSAIIGASPGNCPDGFPVVLFSPGLGSVNFVSTFFALEFASRGFIMVGINHPGSSASTMLANGMQIGLETIKKEVFLGNLDASYAFLAKTSAKQSTNISVVLDEVMTLNLASDSSLYQRINPDKIFAIGHSIGGAASFIACGQDRRISKAINLDGAVADAGNVDYTGKALLLINSDREKFKPKGRKIQIEFDAFLVKDKINVEKLSTKANLKELLFRLTTHYDFADLSILIRPAIGKKIGLLGEVNGLKLLRETSAIMLDFLDE
jgi:alpha-beta hydrolase superfamily lysophospholipase